MPTIVEFNDDQLEEAARGGMLSKEPSSSTLQRELGRWKQYSKSEKVEAYVRLGAGWPRLLLRVREAQLKEKKSKNRVEWNKQSNHKRTARKASRKAAQEAALALLRQDVGL